MRTISVFKTVYLVPIVFRIGGSTVCGTLGLISDSLQSSNCWQQDYKVTQLWNNVKFLLLSTGRSCHKYNFT